MIAVVALLVIGPERLPKVARTVGLWIGRARRFVGSVKADIEQELRAEELKRILDQQAKSNPLEEIVEETRKAVKDINKAGASLKSDLEDSKPKDKPPTSETGKSAHG